MPFGANSLLEDFVRPASKQEATFPVPVRASGSSALARSFSPMLCLQGSAYELLTYARNQPMHKIHEPPPAAMGVYLRERLVADFAPEQWVLI
jgi:hypothetical protein